MHRLAPDDYRDAPGGALDARCLGRRRAVSNGRVMMRLSRDRGIKATATGEFDSNVRIEEEEKNPFLPMAGLRFPVLPVGD